MRNDTIIKSAKYTDNLANGFPDKSILDAGGRRPYVTIEGDMSTPKDIHGARFRGVPYAIITLDVLQEYLDDIDAKWRDDTKLYWEFLSKENETWRSKAPSLPNIDRNGYVVLRIPCDELEQVE